METEGSSVFPNLPSVHGNPKACIAVGRQLASLLCGNHVDAILACGSVSFPFVANFDGQTRVELYLDIHNTTNALIFVGDGGLYGLHLIHGGLQICVDSNGINTLFVMKPSDLCLAYFLRIACATAFMKVGGALKTSAMVAGVSISSDLLNLMGSITVGCQLTGTARKFGAPSSLRIA